MEALRRLAGRYLLSLVLLAIAACSGQVSDDTAEEAAPPPPRLVRQIENVQSRDFSVSRVSMEGIAIRVDVQLSESPVDRATLERQTRNALFAIQSAIGTEDHLAVWAFTGNPPVLQGMAFYSSLTEQYTFKTSGEIQ